MVDIQSEKLLSLSAAARSLPNRPPLSTLHRWRLRGIRGINLETILVGGRRYTSAEALARFFEQTTAAADGEPTPSRTNRQRQAALSHAEKELDRAGI